MTYIFKILRSGIALSAIALFAVVPTYADFLDALKGQPTFEFTGTVYDDATGKPLEGAYALAIYVKPVFGPHSSDVWCVKTRGMYTESDGVFRFPVEQSDGMSPIEVIAIKPGYFLESIKGSGAGGDRGRAAWHSGRDVHLSPQPLSGRPEFRMGDRLSKCSDAKTKEDGRAALTFLKIQQAEYIRLNSTQAGMEGIQAAIERLERLP